MNLIKIIFFGFIIAFVIGLILFVGRCSSVGVNPNYSAGSRVGSLVKFSQKGLFNKSGEGTLMMQGNYKDPNSGALVPIFFRFSTMDTSKYAEFESMVGKNVIVHYNQYWLTPTLKVDNDYIATKIEVVE